MRLSFANDRVLAVMAHPDDAELLCAGTLARAKADGAAICIMVMCRGEKGASSKMKSADLSDLRCSEAEAASKVIDAEIFWAGEPDGELFDDYPQRLMAIESYRRFKPTLVIAHASEDYHADHRAASQLAEAASWFCASRGHVTQVPVMDRPPRLWFADTIGMHDFSPDFYVDVSAHVDIKQRMLACHKSQLERGADGDFAPLAALMQRQYETRGAQADVAAAEAFRWHHAFKRMGAF
jgi:LmbE family N-acetylglucosaminyl deacetylase